MSQASHQTNSVVNFADTSLAFGSRVLWKELSLTVQAGEFVAILGPNGVGKSTLLKVLLGVQSLTSGHVTVFDQSPQRGNHAIGYVPQQKGFDPSLPLTGRGLVQLGLNGYSFGWRPVGVQNKRRIDEALEQVGAADYADEPIGLLSGGEQQRLRIAQALVSRPRLLLCDEPLLSLDLASQQTAAQLIHDYSEQQNAAVLFVTHEVNPILPYVDKILYMANQKWILDTPDRVLRSDTLSKLYGARVEVLHVHNRILIVGAEDAGTTMFVDHVEGHHA